MWICVTAREYIVSWEGKRSNSQSFDNVGLYWKKKQQLDHFTAWRNIRQASDTGYSPIVYAPSRSPIPALTPLMAYSSLWRGWWCYLQSGYTSSLATTSVIEGLTRVSTQRDRSIANQNSMICTAFHQINQYNPAYLPKMASWVNLQSMNWDPSTGTAQKLQQE
jgi:hypothetical protein